jgi:hypothetical protein
MNIIPFLLLFFGMGSTIALSLPSGFKVKPTTEGFDLVWTSDSVTITMGASRYEFRFEDGTVLGYPREIQGGLRLPLTSTIQATLDTQGATLQVWRGSKRIDANAPLSPVQMPEVSADAPVVTTPTIDINPAQLGSFTTRRDTYNLTTLVVEEYFFPIEVVAEVTDPPQAPGKRPLILFLHGRHPTCYQGGPNGFVFFDWPCPDDYLPLPSYQGYRYITDILASQGYIVASISANGINGQDFFSDDLGSSSRSILIRYHLSLWAQWNANGGSPWGDRFKGRLDMNQVVLVGHAHGGEGAHRAAIDASPSDPYKIVGIFAFGPTAYNVQMTPDVHSATILPTCDGEISNLEGQFYVDDSRDIAYSEALRSAVISLGANNYFFNTEWTPGSAVAPAIDDWDVFYDSSDPVCGSMGGSVRLTAQEQQVVGATYTVAFVKLAVNQDVTVLPLLDGSYVRPAIIGRADVATNTVGGAKYRLLYRVQDAGRPALRNGMSGLECVGNFNQVTTSKLPACANGNDYPSPHWYAYSMRPSSFAMELKWNNRLGAIAQFTVPTALRDLTTLDSLDVRIANDPDRSGVRFDLVVADQSGRNATLSTNVTTIEGWPGQDNLDRVHARTLRGSLASVRSKVNLGNIVYVFLVARSATGRVWVLDIAASQARIQTPVVLNLPKLSIQDVEVTETDGFKRYTLNIIADRPLTTNAAVWVQPFYGTGYQLNLVPSGTSTVVGQITYDFVGDDIFSTFFFSKGFYLEAVRGIVTGDYDGTITILEDEAAPKVRVKASNVTAREGSSLKWTVKLSAPTAGISLYFTAVKPGKGKELSSRDVPDSWLASAGVFPIPLTPVLLSELGLVIEVRFGYGIRSVDLLIPLTNDGTMEGNEIVVLKQQYSDFGDLLTLTGNVVDN